MSLIRALDESDMAGTARILDLSPGEVSSRDSEDRVALHYAAESANAETFKRILELDSSLIDCQDQNGYTPLLIASMSGNVPAMKILIENGAQINHMDKDKHSAVHWAVVCGQLEALMTLLDNGAKVDGADNQGAQPVHYSTAAEDISPARCEAILHILLKHDAKANARDIDGRTPVLWAASNGNLDAMISLAKAGGDFYAVDRDRLGVMHCAASHGHEHVIEHMIGALDPAIVNSIDRNGDTPLFYAVTLGHYDCARLLLLNGAEVNHQDHHLRCPSHCAAAKGQLRMLKLLKHFGGSFEIQNARGDLPIHEAVQAGAKDCVEYLLALHPSSVDATNHEGRTGLHLAAASGNMEMVILLCTRNAVISPLMLYKDTLYTPLDLAKRKNHELVVDYLRLRQSAKLAEELPEEMKKMARSHLEHQITGVLDEDNQKGVLPMELSRMFDAKGKTATVPPVESASQETQTTKPDFRATATNTSRPVTSASVTAEQQTSHAQQLLPKSTSTTDLERYLPVAQQQQKSKQISETANAQQGKWKVEKITVNDSEWKGTNHWTSGEEEEEEEVEEVEVEEVEEEEVEEDEERAKNKRRSMRVISSKKKKNGGIIHNELKENVHPREKSARERMRKKVTKTEGAGKKWDEDEKLNADIGQDHSVLSDSADSQSGGSVIAVNGGGVNGHQKQHFQKKLSKHTDAHRHDDFERKLKEFVGSQRVDIYQNEANGTTIQKQASRKCKKIGECYAHEQAIFEELTHLKKMQLQYGKVKEQVLVRTLINNFCKMHDLNPAHFKFQTFHSWEKFLHDQLKLLYLEERNRIMGSRNLSYPATNRFQTRLQHAQAIPLNVRLDDLATAYRGSTLGTITEGPRSAKSDISRRTQHTGEKRCNCLYNKRDLL